MSAPEVTLQARTEGFCVFIVQGSVWVQLLGPEAPKSESNGRGFLALFRVPETDLGITWLVIRRLR